MEKGYVLKDVIYNIQTGEQLTYYIGRDGYVQDDIKWCDAYRKRGNVENLIKRDMLGHKVITENVYIEGDRWIHVTSICEVEIL